LRHQSAGLAAGGAVHGAEHRELGLSPVTAEALVGDALIEVTAACCGGERRVLPESRQHPRFELRGIGDDEDVALVRSHGVAHLVRDLQRSAAPRRPASGHDTADHVLRAEAAVVHPGVEPGPAVGGQEPGEFLVGEERRNRRVLLALEFPGPRGPHLDPRPVQCSQDLLRRVRIQARVAESRAQLAGEPLQLPRPGALRRPGAQAPFEQLLVDVPAPGEAPELHLGGDEGSRRLGRDEQVEARSFHGIGDGGELPAELVDDVVEERTRRGLRFVEQRLLVRCGRKRRQRGPCGFGAVVRPGRRPQGVDVRGGAARR
jgi:hypothetical protein